METDLFSILETAFVSFINDLLKLLPILSLAALVIGVVLLICRAKKTGTSLIGCSILGFIIYCLNYDIFSYIEKLFN